MDKPKRLGLALSGGGFRAAFFHIGVLARMAELDLLRRVEVISTVSGGSIVGALYYLHVKKLLESKPDTGPGCITSQDYLTVVRNVEAEFLAAVQTNLRLRAFANPWCNMKMVLPWYSRSDRLAELYDRIIYRPAWGSGIAAPIEMRRLRIRPMGSSPDFHPVKDNDSRMSKVPILVINATSLNTGHNWRFTASRMGEPPIANALTQDIDGNTVLQQERYDHIVPAQSDFPLGHAVAASASVPGILPPLAVSDLYRDWRVQLVDGGVFDNQGISALLDSRYPCTHVAISDASSELRDANEADGRTVSVIMRTLDVLMERVREEMLQDLIRNLGPANVMFVHLGRGLGVNEVAPMAGADAIATIPVSRPGSVSLPTLSIRDDVQRRISRIRTDLDSFCDMEAKALSADGYLLTRDGLTNLARSFMGSSIEPAAAPWGFSVAIPQMEAPGEILLTALDAAAHRFGKPFRLGVTPGLAAAVAGCIAGVAVIYAPILWLLWLIAEAAYPGFLVNLAAYLAGCLLDAKSLLSIVVAALLFGALEVASRFLGADRYPKLTYVLRSIARGPISVATSFLLPLLGSIPILIYMRTIDRYYLHRGRM